MMDSDFLCWDPEVGRTCFPACSNVRIAVVSTDIARDREISPRSTYCQCCFSDRCDVVIASAAHSRPYSFRYESGRNPERNTALLPST